MSVEGFEEGPGLPEKICVDETKAEGKTLLSIKWLFQSSGKCGTAEQPIIGSNGRITCFCSDGKIHQCFFLECKQYAFVETVAQRHVRVVLKAVACCLKPFGV